MQITESPPRLPKIISPACPGIEGAEKCGISSKGTRLMTSILSLNSPSPVPQMMAILGVNPGIRRESAIFRVVS